MQALSAALVVLLGLLAVPSTVEEPFTTSPPLETDLEEHVEVKFVLLDVVVVDRKGRSRPDVALEDFELLVDDREVEIASLDLNCPIAKAADARAYWRGKGGRRPVVDEDTGIDGDLPPRRLVLVFDYFHMDRVRAYEGALDAVDRWGDEADEHMIVSLGGNLKVELPLTGDLGLVRATLEKMYRDPSLFAGNHSHLTEWRFFDRVERLFDVLEPLEGRKIIVLFSGPNRPDGFYHDVAFTRLAARSAIARTAVYPVDTTGLNRRRLGGPEQLRRLAVETGGRMTADTNDLGLAYGRAQRDLSCTYTLGFYDERPRLDRPRKVVMWARKKQPGLRVIHPAFYVVRSEEQKRRSMARTAAIAPELFRSEDINAELIAVESRNGKSWEALVAVDVAARLIGGASAGEPWTLQAFVRRPNGTLVRALHWRIPDENVDPIGLEGRIVRAEMIRARPGSYRISAVLSGPSLPAPLTAFGEVELPAITD